MQWYEILIAVIAAAIVALPIILHFVNKKKGKHSCGCGCDCGCTECSSCEKCKHESDK